MPRSPTLTLTVTLCHHSLLFFHSELGETAFSDYVIVHAILFSLQPIERRKDHKDVEHSSTRFTFFNAHSFLHFSLYLNLNTFLHSFRSRSIYLFRLSFPGLFHDMCILTSLKWIRYEAVQHRCCFWPMIFMTFSVYLSVSDIIHNRR